ncbi:MAG: hypothetical protein JWO59_3347, partial [Chloroflexi bacterium]|nr:hypothetical protein [Chloroflexota bacterium]
MSESQAKLHRIPAGSTTSETAQTSGMQRFAAISGATVGAQTIWMGEAHT